WFAGRLSGNQIRHCGYNRRYAGREAGEIANPAEGATMPTAIDHVVILVEDLDQAVRQYEQLGFTVVPGGKHARYTHNALITFQDGSYLELIAFYEAPDPASGTGHRWYRHLSHGGGLIDFAVGTDDVTSVVAATSSRGLSYDGPHPGQRARPDGQQLAWRSAMVGAGDSAALPFVIEDITDRGLRVPAEASTHSNGVRGISALIIAVDDLDAAVGGYQRLLDKSEPDGTSAGGAYFLIGPHRVELASSVNDGPVANQLSERGTGLFELQLLASEERDIDPSAAGGARLRLVAR
ncbi:MAG TPA: VOC family protein, partial [Thermomicrobiales bacterium]|nr:VOC family protein [Thermomicrobiales bacterium]